MKRLICLLVSIVLLVSTFYWVALGRDRPNVALVFFGSSTGDVKETIKMAQAVGAQEIYMYVAYEGKVYARKPSGLSSDGLRYEGDQFIRQAIDLFHQSKLKVTAVFSTQIFGPKPGPQAYALLQRFPDGSYSDLIDPQKSLNKMLSLTQEVAAYGVDGIYLGEPYYDNYTVRYRDNQRSEHWNNFYGQINQSLHLRYTGIKTKLVLPVHYFNYQGFKFGAGEQDHGLNPNLVQEDFNELGLDMSSIYHKGNVDELKETEVMAALAQKLGGKNSIGELSVNKFGSSTNIPLDFLIKQIDILKKYDINTFLLFSNKALRRYSQRELANLKAALWKQSTGHNKNNVEVVLHMRQTSNWREDISRQVQSAKLLVKPETFLDLRLDIR